MGSSPTQWSARVALLMCLGVLAVLVTQLPGPAEMFDALTAAAPSPVEAAAPLAAVQSIVLITAGLIAWLLVGWVLAVVAASMVARLPGRPGHRARRMLPRIAPASVGRLVAAAVGVSLMAGTAACAAPAGTGAPGGTTAAVTSSGPATASAVPSSQGDPDGSITIDWPDAARTSSTPSPAVPVPATTEPTPTEPTPTAGAPSGAASSPAAPGPELPTVSTPTEDIRTGSAGSVTVRPGDSLWRIAAASLRPDAPATEVDNAWRAWYFVNRQVIGDDPDVIVPGQSLVAPTAGRQVRS